MPRYLIVTEAQYLGGAWLDERMILVEEENGMLRHAEGDDLVEIDRRFPRIFGRPQPNHMGLRQIKPITYYSEKESFLG